MTGLTCGMHIQSDVQNALSFCAMSVTDSNVSKLYPSLTEGAFVIPAGEESKSPEILFDILAEMNSRGIKRNDRIAAVGGGVVSDITGLAASLYMRGVDWVSVPTTLLAMVDAGIGGKTAINYCGVKNLIGAFHFPVKAVISYDFCDTLSRREMLSGYGEIIKTCLLTEKAYELLLNNVEGLERNDVEVLKILLDCCIEIKNAVVAADPMEEETNCGNIDGAIKTSTRKILNVGHTVGHALESADGYKLSHGEYVIKGMMAECAMCKDLIDDSYYNELISIFKKFSAPPRTTARAVCDIALRDKKNTSDKINIMLPTKRGIIKDVSIAPDEFIERYSKAIKELKNA